MGQFQVGHKPDPGAFWCSITIKKDELTKGSLHLSQQFGNIDSYQLCLEYIPSIDFRSPWKRRVVSNGLTQIEVTFEPKGLGLEVEVMNFLLILFSLVD